MTAQELKKVFASFENAKILVIGDVMIDSYIIGDVSRISPEAPVPVLFTEKRESRLGGAANVALNLKSLGAEPIMCSVIGNDPNSDLFFQLLDDENLSPGGILVSRKRITTEKTRLISQGQQLMRFDTEITFPISDTILESFSKRIIALIKEVKPDAIVFEDYDKGVISPPLIEKVVQQAKIENIPTLVDPKKRNFTSYKGVSLFKPNLKEFKEGTRQDIDTNDLELMFDAMERMRKIYNYKYLVTTLSNKGIAAVAENQQLHFPAEKRDIADVSGAGDTVISVATLALAKNLELKDVVVLSNIAGGLVCEKSGVVPVDKNELFNEALKYYERNS
ncbi:MAG: hypothetical protein KAI79_01520 [Bacteroidales bacterium]|nr:hypothetical protein [Bacteroidales bacterium]